MKGIKLLVVGFFLVVGMATLASAENFSTMVELEEKWNLGISSSAVIMEDNNNLIFDTGFNLQGLLSYDVTNWLALGCEVGWTRVDVSIDTNSLVSGSKFDLGTLNNVNVLGDIILKYPIEMGETVVVPYITNGFGVVVPSLDESDLAGLAGVTVDVETAFLYKLGGGIDFYITEVLGLNVEASYQWASTSYDVKVRQTTFTADGDLNALYIGGGLKLKF